MTPQLRRAAAGSERVIASIAGAKCAEQHLGGGKMHGSRPRASRDLQRIGGEWNRHQAFAAIKWR